MELLKELEAWRVYNNVTLEGLADMLGHGITYGTVYRWCRKDQKKILKPYEQIVRDFLEQNR